MLTITVICVGGLKEAFWKNACAEYQKRLGAWAKVNMIEIAEVRLPEEPSASSIHRGLEDEADRIIKKVPQNSYLTALCVEGRQYDSEEFSSVLSGKMQESGSFTFIIGGSNGLAQRVKDRANLKLSFSAMTFPHMIARVLLLEQLYRALSIMNGGKYHK